jgi:transcriptional regulator with GAF, ATPase, and Fis domain
VRGSFTGAFRDRAGKLEAADRGTIFLDEVGEMSLRMQALLLRFLETGEIQSVGSDAPSTVVDVRVVAATNRDLAAMVAQRGFREDLLFRINVTHIEVPPLRDRREDIRHFVRYFVEESGRDYQITEAALRTLEAYHWPGNVRELYNVIEQALSLASADRIDLADLPARIATAHGATRTVRRERRRSVADGLYEQLVSGACRFWDDIHPLFLSRDLTRADLRQLIGLGLQASGGNYRMLLDQFGMDQSDYKRLLNFLAAHDCSVDCKVYRVRRAAPLLTSRLPSGTGGAVAAQPPVIV